MTRLNDSRPAALFAPQADLKKYAIVLLKLAVPVAIILWLAFDIRRNDPETFSRISNQPKDWGRLTAAMACCSFAISIAFFRWYLLVRALGIPFRIRDGLRLGFIGYLFNFVALGSMGGDLFKALFIAYEQQARRLEAVATIAVDRVIGFFGLLAVASIGVMTVQVPDSQVEIQVVANCILVVTLLAATAVILLLSPLMPRRKVAALLSQTPKIGRWLERLVVALGMYRQQKRLLAGMWLMSMMVHALLAFTIYMAANALYAQTPSLLEHFVMGPMASVVASLPISPSGLGTYELAMKYLYDHLPSGDAGQGKGLVVALSYRMMQIAIASVGVVYYCMNRRKVNVVLHDAETSEVSS